MTLKELCNVIPATTKLRIRKRANEPVGIVCVRYDVYDPLGLAEIPELAELQNRKVLLIRPDRIQDDCLLIVINKEKEA